MLASVFMVRYRADMGSLLFLLLTSGCLLWPWGGDTARIKDDTGNISETGQPADFCKQELSTAAPGGPDCVTASISCGETIEGTTGGGSSVLDSSLYEDWFCAIPAASYEGSERVYVLDVNGSQDIDIDLDAACGEVDLFALHWVDDTCPYPGVSIYECEGATRDGSDHIDLFTDQSYRFYVIVESRNEKAQNFKLTVNCSGL